jgi:hypothetical protein
LGVGVATDGEGNCRQCNQGKEPHEGMVGPGATP